MRDAIRTLIYAGIVGCLILGIGGRLAMAAVAAGNGARPTFTLGGSLTVIGLGALSGIAGGAIALVSTAVARRAGIFAARHAIFALGMVLVTMRGLRGTPGDAHWYFYSLVALYAVALISVDGRRHRAGGTFQSQRPGRLANE